MSRTMEQFKELIMEINKLKTKQKLLIKKFENSTCELSEVFHWIVQSALNGNDSCCLAIDTCPTLYAQTLENMGFNIQENRNCFDMLCGYEIYWDKEITKEH